MKNQTGTSEIKEKKNKRKLKKNLGPSNDNDAKWGCLGQFLLPKAARLIFSFPFHFFF